MSEQGYAATGGAFDLSHMAAPVDTPAQVGQMGEVPGPAVAAMGEQSPGAEQAPLLVDAPLIAEVTEVNIDAEMALSASVPVILMLLSKNSLASKQALEVMSSLAREDSGAFQLATVDVEASPQLAAAFQANAVPATFALVAGRPVPLFEGVPSAAQAQSLVAEILQVAPQFGVTGRIRVGADDLEVPMPEEHIPAREAEEAGDWARAVKAWKKVLASNPADKEAKLALARARFEKRFEKEQSQGGAASEGVEETPAVVADRLFASGKEKEAFDVLLEALMLAADEEQKEDYRKQLVGLFPIAADAVAVKNARGRLATYLMV